jgi:hypothetical protein
MKNIHKSTSSADYHVFESGRGFGEIGYWQLVQNNALVADGFHSLSDSVNNVIGLVSVYFSRKRNDESHPYGYEKTRRLPLCSLPAWWQFWVIGPWFWASNI